MTDGTKIADDFNDLIDCHNPKCLQNPLNRDATGAPIDPRNARAWTDVLSAQGVATGTGLNCNNWSTDSGRVFGFGGLPEAIGPEWSLGINEVCSAQLHLYCFEQ